ncbi:Protein FGT-1 a [Aphelenchoides avenae]|nr:Protein FGT-1 a [Aphelenchus avenae]
MGIFFVGGMLGSLLSGWLADQMGRKGALLFTNLFMLMAAVLTTSAKYVGVYYLLAIGRLFVGFGCGLGTGLTPMYLIEVFPINLRGTIGSVHQLLVTISMLVGQFLGLPFVWGNEKYWPLIFAFSAVPSLFQLSVLPFCPESPKWSLVVKGSVEQAEKDLQKLRQCDDVSAELEMLKKEEATDRGQAKVSIVDMFGPSLRWPVFIAITMMLSQQLSGINGALFYSNQIFRDAGLSGNEPSYATLAMGAIFVAQTFVSVWLVDRPNFGRRSLHLAGLVGMFFSSIFIMFSLSLSGKKADGNMSHPWASYASIVFVLLFVIAFATGPGSIPWFFASEIFPSNARGQANSIAVLSNWLMSFVVSIGFLPLNNAIGQYSFLVFAAVLAFFISFTWKFVPETKGKTVDEIYRDMGMKK